MYESNNKGNIKHRRKEAISSRAEWEHIPLQTIKFSVSVRILSDKSSLTSSMSTDDGQMAFIQMDLIALLIRRMGKCTVFVEANVE